MKTIQTILSVVASSFVSGVVLAAGIAGNPMPTEPVYKFPRDMKYKIPTRWKFPRQPDQGGIAGNPRAAPLLGEARTLGGVLTNPRDGNIWSDIIDSISEAGPILPQDRTVFEVTETPGVFVGQAYADELPEAFGPLYRICNFESAEVPELNATVGVCRAAGFGAVAIIKANGEVTMVYFADFEGTTYEEQVAPMLDRLAKVEWPAL